MLFCAKAAIVPRSARRCEAACIRSTQMRQQRQRERICSLSTPSLPCHRCVCAGSYLASVCLPPVLAGWRSHAKASPSWCRVPWLWREGSCLSRLCMPHMCPAVSLWARYLRFLNETTTCTTTHSQSICRCARQSSGWLSGLVWRVWSKMMRAGTSCAHLYERRRVS